MTDLKFIIYLPTIIILGLLSLIIIFSNYKSKQNQTFFIFNLCVLEWLVCLFIADLGIDYNTSWLFVELGLIGPIWIPYVFIRFSNYFPVFDKRFFYTRSVIMVLGIVPVILTILSFTQLHLKQIVLHDWGVEVVPGILYPIFYVYFFGYIAISFYLIIKKYGIVDKLQRQQIKFLIIGGFLTAFISLTTNIVFVVFNLSEFGLIGVPAILILVIFTAYSILKHSLFNIKIIATEIFVGTLSIISFVQIFLSKSNIELALRLVLSVAVIIFSYLVIRSILKEAKQSRQIEELNSDLQKASVVIKKKNIHLEKLLKMRSEFLDIASHQLHTPTTYILGMIDMIAERSGEEMPKEKLEQILKNIQLRARKLDNIVDDLLDASEMDTGEFKLDLQAVQIEDALKHEMETLRPRAIDKKIRLIYNEPAKPLPKVLSDERYLGEAIRNLIDNAICYTSDGGTVEVNLMENQKNVVFSVKDTGIGIPKEEQAKLFRKFQRGSNAKEEHTDGSGLGLFIVKKIIDGHKNSKVWFESEANKGTTFYISLPIYS